MEQNTSEYSISGLTTISDIGKLERTSSESSFKFSYISYSEFNAIFKQVKRERRRKREAKNWEKFLQKQSAKENEDGCSGDCKKIEKRDGSTITCNISPLQREPFFYREPKKPHLIKAPVSTLVNEAGTGDNADGDHENKENFTTDINPVLSNVGQDIIKFVHASSDGNEEDSNSNFEKDFKKVKFGRKVDRKYALRKIEGLQAKIIMSLNGIQEVMIKDPFEGVSKSGIDVIRNKKRNIAFAARFKRNYHYHLVCQINEIQKLLRNDMVKKTKPNIIMEKLLSSHQVVFQALQVIEKQVIGAYPVDEPFLWLREFTESICELTSLLSVHEGGLDKYDDVKIACEELVEAIEEFNERMAEVKIYDKISNKASSKKIKTASKQDNLWMYRNKFACKKIRSNKTSIKIL